MTRDHYLSILGLSGSASLEEVQDSFDDLCRVWNPERFKDDAHLWEVAKTKHAELNDAYSYLIQDPVIQARQTENLDLERAFAQTVPEQDSPPPPESISRDLSATDDTIEEDETVLSNLTDFLPRPRTILINAFITCTLAVCIAKCWLAPTPSTPPAAPIVAASPTPQSISTPIPREAPTLRELPLPTSPIDSTEVLEERTYPPSPSERRGHEGSLPRIENFAQQTSSTSETKDNPIDDLFSTEELRTALKNLERGGFKERDKMYLLVRNQEAIQQLINYTPDLVDAAIHCDASLTAKLLDKGADVETIDDNGDNALIWAVRRRCLPVVKLLISRGANVNIKSNNGFTPYVWARVYNSPKIQKELVKAGADTSAGLYWWRFEEDGRQKWLDKSLKEACANKDCK